ncbi:hypothetical protein HMSSN139_29720 [Paenibacillus sp. HMSSN-139]|nr:hypothetical protein HMSSN139_29720 [Paenibacillus sp. HMSSN-139]
MNKQEQVIQEFRDLFNKMAWLNKMKMEDQLKGSSHPKSIVSNRLVSMRIPT